ncbi:formate transporter 1-related [Anaeramoeba ignava]|uniref:Formate transporter 1-related n=1 Tax=Anaeramoeba ignava TaxID=1746090 RepID=A0A9Q0L8Y3_ANAIG|nr:formate transporter 1-related [Anaeramoeba ignava]|eukprot:Anaeramoba_ignava/a349980_28.p1 GENE.a349980_28~~a349980_28.p1  ORF type:complete len:277 (+),score=71.53 a349980_28:55-885(+)
MGFNTPQQTFSAVEAIGVKKANTPWYKISILGFLAGAYIGLGSLLAISVAGQPSDFRASYPGITKLLFGGVFPCGLMLVVIAGAELFTGNTMFLIPAVYSKDSKWKKLLWNWLNVYVTNFIGSIFVSGVLTYGAKLFHEDPYRSFAIGIAEKKVALSWGAVFFRGIGCNWLVCLSIYLAVAAKDVGGKILGIWFPIMAFVAIGFEHCVANMYFIPLGLMYGANFNFGDFIWNNLIPATLGNIIGGSFMTATLYYFVYWDRKKNDDDLGDSSLWVDI